MIEELETLIEDFPGAANQTRCFLHILNLVVKSVIKQFDANDDEKTEMLLGLAGNVDIEGDLMENTEDSEEDDNDEGWIDEREAMTQDELQELAASVTPVRVLLTKARFQIHNYNTIRFSDKILTAEKGRIRHEKLDYDSSSLLVFNPSRTQLSRENDAPGCLNPMEFNI